MMCMAPDILKGRSSGHTNEWTQARILDFSGKNCPVIDIRSDEDIDPAKIAEFIAGKLNIVLRVLQVAAG